MFKKPRESLQEGTLLEGTLQEGTLLEGILRAGTLPEGTLLERLGISSTFFGFHQATRVQFLTRTVS